MPFCCCSSSDLLLSHYTVFCPFFLCLFHAPLDIVVPSPVFPRSFRIDFFLLSFLILSHRSRMLAVTQGFVLLAVFAKDLTVRLSLATRLPNDNERHLVFSLEQRYGKYTCRRLKKNNSAGIFETFADFSAIGNAWKALLLWGMQVGFPILLSISRCGFVPPPVFSVFHD